jgi:hypothetical protein
LAKISSEGYRFPEPAEEVQVNFCKNVRCSAFGVPETLHRTKRPPGEPPQPGDYSFHGPSGTLMKCGVCGSYMPIRSNEGVVEEVRRLRGYMQADSAPSCPNEDCSNEAPVTEPGRYARFAHRAGAATLAGKHSARAAGPCCASG